MAELVMVAGLTEINWAKMICDFVNNLRFDLWFMIWHTDRAVFSRWKA